MTRLCSPRPADEGKDKAPVAARTRQTTGAVTIRDESRTKKDPERGHLRFSSEAIQDQSDNQGQSRLTSYLTGPV